MVADDTPAIEVVLRADKKRLELLQERDQLEADMKKKNKEVDMDRLQEVYEELKAIGADKAEPKARRWGDTDGCDGLVCEEEGKRDGQKEVMQVGEGETQESKERWREGRGEVEWKSSSGERRQKKGNEREAAVKGEIKRRKWRRGMKEKQWWKER